MNLAVVDTNVVSYIFNRDTRSALYNPILAQFETGVISFTTVVECLYGATKKNWGPRRITELNQFLAQFNVYHTDDLLCELYVRVVLSRAKRGTAIDPPDAWIAATALLLDCPLVTHNARHFRDIDNLIVMTAPT